MLNGRSDGTPIGRPWIELTYLVLLIVALPRLALAQDTSVAPSFLIDPSPRSSSMGGASGAVFWGEPDSWANPAMLGLGSGLQYSWSEAALTPAVPNRAHDRIRSLTLEGGGLGLELAGTPALLRGSTYDGQLLVGYDTNLNLLGYFTYAESVEAVAGGIAILRAAESLAYTTGWFRMPQLSRYGEVSLGWRSKQVSSGYFVDHVTVHDVGWLLRLTPYNAMDGAGFVHWPTLDRRASLRIDLAYGRSTQNSGNGSLFTWSTTQVEPIPELDRKGLATRVSLGCSRDESLSWRDGQLGWILDFISPSATLGYARDWIVPSRQDPSTAVTATGPTVNRSGWEITLADVFSYRWGRIEDPDAGVNGSTSGFGVGVGYRRTCGIRYDWATVPRQTGSSSTRQEGIMVYLDPLAVWRGLR